MSRETFERGLALAAALVWLALLFADFTLLAAGMVVATGSAVLRYPLRGVAGRLTAVATVLPALGLLWMAVTDSHPVIAPLPDAGIGVGLGLLGLVLGGLARAVERPRVWVVRVAPSQDDAR